MTLKVGFIGFRHGHIHALYRLLSGRHDATIAAACEEDAGAREAATEAGVHITHTSYEALLAEADCDVIACGDYYRIRGERLVRALRAGKHIIGDKPLCTRLSELDQIQALATERALSAGCMLDLPGLAPFQTLRRLIQEGILGEIHTVVFEGQHPLRADNRPAWYFEEGKHGGTINDIAIHGIDALPWLTGRRVTEITAARAWNARYRACPSFQDGAMLMLKLDNGGGVLGDVSYLTPDSHGYATPNYWRFAVTGSRGYAETACTSELVRLYADGEPAQEVPLDPAKSGEYWEDFVRELNGTPSSSGLTTRRVLRSSRIALLAQHAADTGQFPCAAVA